MKLDSNGYAPSIMGNDEDECFICGISGVDLVRHEAIYGTANRRNSKKWGLWVTICTNCHKAIHEMPECKYVDLALKQTAQKCFIDRYGREKFREVFGRYYD